MELENFSVNERTIVRIMLYEIRERNPDSIKFIIKDRVVTMILLCLKTRRYDSIIHLYGKNFLLEILKMFEENENFEECVHIINQINKI